MSLIQKIKRGLVIQQNTDLHVSPSLSTAALLPLLIRKQLSINLKVFELGGNFIDTAPYLWVGFLG